MPLDESRTLKPVTRQGEVFDTKQGRYFSAIGTGTHSSGVRSIANTQSQRIQQNRFSRTSLTCDAGHAAAQLYIEALDNGVVANG
jgi:hypothetical protein